MFALSDINMIKTSPLGYMYNICTYILLSMRQNEKTPFKIIISFKGFSDYKTDERTNTQSTAEGSILSLN